MTDPNDTLRSLIRLIPPARALRESLEKSLHLELYEGTGEFAVQSFQGLQSGAAAITSDPVVAALAIRPDASAGDREKVSLVLLAAGQLTAYLEGQTGLIGLGSGKTNIQTAPYIQGNSIYDNKSPGAEKLMEALAGAMGEENEAPSASAS